MDPRCAHQTVRAVDVVVRGVEPRFPPRLRKRRRRLSVVQDGCVVELLEGVHVELPVGVDLGAVVPALGHLVERIALERGDHRTEELVERLLRRLAREVDEDEAVPDVAVHGDEAVVVLVDAEELTLLLDEGALPSEAVAPAVVFANELPAAALGLLRREVVPHEFVAAMAADVVERSNRVAVTRHDDRRPSDLDLLGEV